MPKVNKICSATDFQLLSYFINMIFIVGILSIAVLFFFQHCAVLTNTETYLNSDPEVKYYQNDVTQCFCGKRKIRLQSRFSNKLKTCRKLYKTSPGNTLRPLLSAEWAGEVRESGWLSSAVVCAISVVVFRSGAVKFGNWRSVNTGRDQRVRLLQTLWWLWPVDTLTDITHH